MTLNFYKNTSSILAVVTYFIALQPVVSPAISNEPAETIHWGDEEFRVEWFAKERFDSADWQEKWAVEGNSNVHAEDGWVIVGKSEPNLKNVATLWYREELPQNIIIRVRARTLPTEGLNAANLNLFLHAREADGSPLQFGRSGDYTPYHEIPNYIVTLTGGFQPGWSRVRRNPGFNLMSDDLNTRSEVGHDYELLIVFQGGRLLTAIDGKPIHDWTDPEPLPGGRFGLRTWTSKVAWTDIEFGHFANNSDLPLPVKSKN